MLTIDGSQGEGGGQVLRTSLALSLVTGRPFRIVNIRANRPKPGLMRQHLTSVEAAAKVGHAEVEGAVLRSHELTFQPRSVEPGEFHFSVGTAGSTTLVLQTVLPALLTASERSVITLEGGTHNPFAPPFEFLSQSFLPLIRRMGPRVAARLERPGFYPGGGGRMVVEIEPASSLAGFELLERGEIRKRLVKATVSALPRAIAERELNVMAAGLGLSEVEREIEDVASPRGPGNVVTVIIECQHVTEVCTAFGRRGVPAEKVAREAVESARRYLDSDVPVGEHLADQLLVPLAIAGRGRFRTMPLTPHTVTNIEVLTRFLGVKAELTPLEPIRRTPTLPSPLRRGRGNSESLLASSNFVIRLG
jgi:RNA 3'-terminal phosphate cyclase (ATP)